MKIKICGVFSRRTVLSDTVGLYIECGRFRLRPARYTNMKIGMTVSIIDLTNAKDSSAKVFINVLRWELWMREVNEKAK